MSIAIDLWIWPLDVDPDAQANYAALLGAEDRRRATSFVKPQDGARFVAARGRLRQILADYTNTRATDLMFDTVKRGKPVLADGPAFNLSHAGGWAALAVAPDAPDLSLGIDIEAIRPINPAVATKAFSQAEQAELQHLLPADWMRGFFNGWTRKEAVIKATGDGLGLNLQSFDISLTPGAPARFLASRGPLAAPAAWRLVNLDTGPGLCGALAAVTHGAELGPITLRQGNLPMKPS